MLAEAQPDLLGEYTPNDAIHDGRNVFAMAGDSAFLFYSSSIKVTYRETLEEV